MLFVALMIKLEDRGILGVYGSTCGRSEEQRRCCCGQKCCLDHSDRRCKEREVETVLPVLDR